jgi:hypothetical protein
MTVIDPRNAEDVVELDGFAGRYSNAHGWTVGFEEYTIEEDPAPLFAGLPDDACQATHLGYVIAGKVTFRTTSGSVETIDAGHAYVVPPGHVPMLHAGTRVVEFSPTDELAATMDVVMRNIKAMQGS